MSAIEIVSDIENLLHTASSEYDNASELAKMKVLLSDLKLEMEQDKRDAERYREIKNGYQSGNEIEVHKRKYSFKLQFTNYEYEVFDSLDKAIDAAIAAKKDGV